LGRLTRALGVWDRHLGRLGFLLQWHKI
jgi:hypothetical protein